MFQLTIGYTKTKDIKKYLLRLLAFGFLAQFPFFFLIEHVNSLQGDNYTYATNVMFTLFLGIIAMLVYDFKPSKYFINKDKKFHDKNSSFFINLDKFSWLLKIPIIAAVILLANFLHTDYGGYGVFLILFVHIFYPKNKFLFSFLFILINFVYYYHNMIGLFNGFSNITTLKIVYLMAYTSVSIIPLIIMLLYNGEKGKNLKYFVYGFYPVHLWILYFSAKIMGIL